MNFRRLMMILGCLTALAGCSDSVEDNHAKIALNWVAEPEFGGIYEAKRLGLFTHHGVNVEITGGANAPVIQMVASGQVDFGIASADEVVIARERGTDIVALFATYQTCPQGIMVHAARGLKTIDEVFTTGTLAVEPGLPYVKFLESKYGFGTLKVVPYNYSIASFLDDKNFAQQCFVTSEPIAARAKGVDTQVFLVADSGYNPYTAVVITRMQTIQQHPRMVHAFIAGLREGWTSYLAGPDEGNRNMTKLNPAMDLPTFNLAAKAQWSLITGEPEPQPIFPPSALKGGDDSTPLPRPVLTAPKAPKIPVGSMTAERWATLIKQLVDLKLVTKPPRAEDCFLNADKLPLP